MAAKALLCSTLTRLTHLTRLVISWLRLVVHSQHGREILNIGEAYIHSLRGIQNQKVSALISLVQGPRGGEQTVCILRPQLGAGDEEAQ